MTTLNLYSPYDVQQNLAKMLREKRKAHKLSRKELAVKSTVPAATIKRFETTGEISLRQFVLLWCVVDDINRLMGLTSPQSKKPTSIDEVLRS